VSISLRHRIDNGNGQQNVGRRGKIRQTSGMDMQGPQFPSDRGRLAWPRAVAAILMLALAGWAGLLMALDHEL
jgi:hypothetical protein